MIVLYVDDLGIAYSNKKDLEKLLQDLTDLGLEFTRKGTFTDFLGIKFVKDEVNNTVTLTQKGLIKKLITATGMHDCNPNYTPALQLSLGTDPDREPMDEFWSYRSIVGMFLYLSTKHVLISPTLSVKLPGSATTPRRVMPVQSRPSSDT